MQIRELTIPDAYEVTPKLWADDRGVFLESYRFDRLEEAVGHPLDLRQVNVSVSAQGVLRGIHYAEVPAGQAKYLTVMHGSILDIIVDLRTGSPTFGTWTTVELDDVDRRAVYIAEGLGHGFVALEDDTVVSYLVTSTFDPEREHGIDPFDAELGIEYPFDRSALLVSPKDAEAESLTEAAAAGRLPSLATCRDLYAELGDRAAEAAEAAAAEAGRR